MRFGPEHYLEASRERIFSAFQLYQSSRYAASIYFSGVAVECLLRAYRLRITDFFDERHDLNELWKNSLIVDFFPNQRREISGNLTVIWRRWKNDYRYASEERLSSEFRRIGLFKGIRGNPLKENARVAYISANNLIKAGVVSWNHSRKKF